MGLADFSLGLVLLHLHQGYIKMFEIPAGARHLLIQEADATSHHLGESRVLDSSACGGSKVWGPAEWCIADPGSPAHLLAQNSWSLCLQ